jgi:hypothetical protein
MTSNYFNVIPSLLGDTAIPAAGLAAHHLAPVGARPYAGAAGSALMAAGLAPEGDGIRTGIFTGLGAMGGGMLASRWGGSGAVGSVLNGALMPLGALMGRRIADASRVHGGHKTAALWYSRGALEVLEKLGMARNTPGLLGGPPRVNAGSINEEYKNLLLQHGGSPMVRHHLREAALPVPQVAPDTAGVLAAMRARLQGPQNPQVAAAQTAEAAARSGQLQRSGQLKISTSIENRMKRLLERKPDLKNKYPKYAADMLQSDPLASFRRSGNISQAFDTNAGMGNNSLGNPGMANPPTTLSMGNLSNAMRWQSDRTGGSAVGIPA